MNLESLNFQQALVWAFGEGNPRAGICIIVALALRLWMPSGQTAQTVYWVKEGNKRARNGLEIPPLTLIRLLNCGILFDLISARKFDIKSSIDEIVALCHQVGPQADAQLSLVLGLELTTYHLQKDNSAAISQSIEQCLEVASRLSSVDVWYKAYLYDNISWWAYASILEDYNLACQYALESWRYFQQAGDRWLVDHLFVLGRAAQAEKGYEKARQCFQEAFSVFREVDDLTGMMRSLVCLADLELTPGGTNRANHAARLMGAVEALIGFWSEKDSWKNEIADFWFPQTMHNLRCWLEPDELKAAWSEGTAMTIEDIFNYILAETGTPSTTP